MDAQRFDPTKKMGLSPLLIPQVTEVGQRPGDQQVFSPSPVMEASAAERQYAFLLVPPPTPRAMHRKKSCDAERLRHSKQKSAFASPVTSPTALSPAPRAPWVAIEEGPLLDSVAFKLPSPRAESKYDSTDSDLSRSASETDSDSEVASPTDDRVDRRIIRPQRSRLGLRKSLTNLRKARSAANLKLPATSTFGVPTPASSDDSLPNSTGTSGSNSDSDADKPPRRPSLATLSSPVALNEVTDTLRRLKSRLNLRDASIERKWNFDEAVEYYERTWARAESGEGAIEVRVEHTRETVTDPRPRSVQKGYPDGIGLYARPRSRKNTMPARDVAEHPREVWL
ncbi:hypothetical protein V8D89_001094 [Ganoderma adspersum]